MKISAQKQKPSVKDFDELIKGFLDKHGNIFFSDIGGETFIYKPLGRKAYKDIVNNLNITDLDKEDLICEETIIWPYDYDADNYDAGVPSKLYEEILTNSFLSSTEDMVYLLEACREETEQLDVQMSCIISEAFPVYDIEEIEAWDMIKFCRIFSKAEWKLKNMRSLEMNEDVVSFLKQSIGATSEEETSVKESQQQTAKQNTTGSKVKVGNKEMSKEEYQQYLDFQRANPQIDWGADSMFTGNDTQTVSTVPTPLRTRT